MLLITVTITQYVDDQQPGWVRVKLVDAWGIEHTFVDKSPVFTAASLDADSHYPQPGLLACQLVIKWQDAQDREIVTVDTELPDHVATIAGETRFDVLPKQIAEHEGEKHPPPSAA